MDVSGVATCLICQQQITVAKEYNIKRHFITKHSDIQDFFSANKKMREDKINELKNALISQRKFMRKFSICSNNEAIKASYLISHKIALYSKPFSDGEFIKECMLSICKVICPEKTQSFINIPLSRHTITRRVNEIGDDLREQLKAKIQGFAAFSLAFDESTDVRNISQLAVFIRGVGKDLLISEEFLDLIPMKGTTRSEDIFKRLMDLFRKFDIKNLIGVTTDGAPQLIGIKHGVVTKLQEKIKESNGSQKLFHIHCIIHREVLCAKILKMESVMNIVVQVVNFIKNRALNHREFDTLLEENEIYGTISYHSEVRWLSKGKMLKKFFELHALIVDFLKMKGNFMQELENVD
jgi:hypothetical protein